MPNIDNGITHSICEQVPSCDRCHCHYCHLQTMEERGALAEERERIRRDAAFTEQVLNDLEKGFEQLEIKLTQAERERDEAREALERCRQVVDATAAAGRAGTKEARQWAIRFRDQLGYVPEEWHQHIDRFKGDWTEWVEATDMAKWPGWLKEGYDPAWEQEE